jgi:hypothetical protein
MSQSKHEDPSIAEVKAVLDRLQRISRRPHGAQTGDDDDAAVAGPAGAHGDRYSLLPVSVASVVPQANASGIGKAPVVIASLLAGFGAVAVVAAMIWRPSAVEAPPTVAVPQDPVPVRAAPAGKAADPVPVTGKEAEKLPGTALQLASDLIAAGQVRAARDVLLRVTQQDSADVAWLLARSYDPNYLVTLTAFDAAPDIAQATRWYRAWFDIAVKQGLVADSVSLDRIIRSMNESSNR